MACVPFSNRRETGLLILWSALSFNSCGGLPKGHLQIFPSSGRYQKKEVTSLIFLVDVLLRNKSSR